MSTLSDNNLASAQVLGTLDAVGRQAAETRRAADQGFDALVESWEARLSPLALTAEEPLPPGLYDRIQARLDGGGLELPGTFTSRAVSAAWQEMLPGLEMRMLHRDEAKRRQTLLVRMQAGAIYPQHGHDGQDEEIYIIDGDLVIGELTLNAGDFHLARAARIHPMHLSRTGCVALINQGY
jgi:hypothetical protein